MRRSQRPGLAQRPQALDRGAAPFFIDRRHASALRSLASTVVDHPGNGAAAAIPVVAGNGRFPATTPPDVIMGHRSSILAGWASYLSAWRRLPRAQANWCFVKVSMRGLGCAWGLVCRRGFRAIRLGGRLGEVILEPDAAELVDGTSLSEDASVVGVGKKGEYRPRETAGQRQPRPAEDQPYAPRVNKPEREPAREPEREPERQPPREPVREAGREPDREPEGDEITDGVVAIGG